MNNNLSVKRFIYVFLVSFILINVVVIFYLELTSKGLLSKESRGLNKSNTDTQRIQNSSESLVSNNELENPFPKISTNTVTPVPPTIGMARGVIIKYDTKQIAIKNLEDAEQSLLLLKETIFFKKAGGTEPQYQPIKLEELKAEDRVTITTAERAGRVYATMVNVE